MEPQKRAQYSKLFDAEELEEILMEDESDEELEELDEVIEPREHMSSLSSSSSNLGTRNKQIFSSILASQDAPGPSAQPPDVTIKEMSTFLAIIMQMGHNQWDTLKDYWSRDEQYYTPFYHNTMVRDRFFHILRFLHFENNEAPPNRDDPENDRLWKIRKIFNNLSSKFYELYHPSEHLAVDEVIVLFKGRVVFR
ncbi:piggyBac transposable element-derived protein 4-like [Cryptotermes secundus]|uniref:piggyBac transposable element-derived protein 4-like n=1 Tax=Cryptotermes secundus TaxID=105785 RepID=UPI000CD7B332|nr:piggyBac transposable element-derived protein 4-like [Cryptotermes secundus]